MSGGSTIPGKLVVRIWEDELPVAKPEGSLRRGSFLRTSSVSTKGLDEVTCKVEFEGHTAYCTSTTQETGNGSVFTFEECKKDAVLDVFEYYGAIPVAITLYMRKSSQNERFADHRKRLMRMIFRSRSELYPSKQVGVRKIRLRDAIPEHYRILAHQAADSFDGTGAAAKSTIGVSASWWGAGVHPPNTWKEYWPSVTIPLSCGGYIKLGVLFVPFLSPERCINGYTELHKAAYFGDAKLVATLLLPRSGSSGALAARTRDSLQATPLDIAAMRGHYDVALQIFSDSSSIHPITVSNEMFNSTRRKTPLHYVVEGGNPELVCFLAIYFGSRCDLVSVANHSRTASDVTLHDSAHNSHHHHSVSNPSRSEERIPLLDVTDENGYSALMLACTKKNMSEAVTRLVEFGADMGLANKQGDTALIIACRMGHFENALALLKTTSQVKYNTSPSSAIPPGSKASLARPNKANFAGERALDCACAYGTCPEVVRALLDACAVPALRRHDGRTALHLAAQMGSRENCEEIVSWLDRERDQMAKAESLSQFVGTAIGQSQHLLLIPDMHGKLASDYAFEAGHKELGEWLKQIEQRDARMLKGYSGKDMKELGIVEDVGYYLETYQIVDEEDAND